MAVKQLLFPCLSPCFQATGCNDFANGQPCGPCEKCGQDGVCTADASKDSAVCTTAAPNAFAGTCAGGVCQVGFDITITPNFEHLGKSSPVLHHCLH
jgi:hypothetical protein